jgi:exodeoxyribonuclease III
VKPLELATYNVNNVVKRLQPLLEWLRRESPDIVCLQELKAEGPSFPIKEIRSAGYGAIWCGQRSWNGVAILARGADPIEIRRRLPGDPADDQARYLEAAARGVIVGCLYLPNGNPQPGPKFAYKLAWFERFIAHAKTLYDSGHPIVLAGDYNVVPTDFDIYNPRSWLDNALLQPEARACYQRLLAQGWLDAIRARRPDERVYTFWHYLRQSWERNAGLRLDHLLVSPDLASRLVDTGVDTWVRALPASSDHAPAWVTLDMSARRKTGRRVDQGGGGGGGGGGAEDGGGGARPAGAEPPTSRWTGSAHSPPMGPKPAATRPSEPALAKTVPSRR